MDPDHAIYYYPFHPRYLNHQLSYPFQPNSGGERFIVPDDDWNYIGIATQSAGPLPGHLGGHDFYYQASSGGSSAAANHQVFLASDSSDAPETLFGTSFHYPYTGPIAYPTTSIPGSLDPLTPEEIQPSFTSFTSNGVQHYRCTCGHRTRRKGDMQRHHESSKHSLRKYFCTLCDRSFTRLDGLRRHNRKMHP